MNQKLRSAKNIVPKTLDSYYPTKAKKITPEPQSNIEVVKLRAALVEAIDQNQIMRGRVMELQAMLAAFQLQMQERQRKFAEDMDRMYQMVQNKDKSQFEKTLKKCNSCMF